MGSWRRFVVLAGAVILLPGLMIYYLSGELKKLAVWQDELEVRPAAQNASVLLQQLQNEGLLEIRIEEPSIVQAPCEYLQDTQVVSDIDLSNLETTEPLEDLCNTRLGESIQRELDLWNSSFRLLSIRDNASRSTNCVDDNREIGRIIATGCRPAGWTISRLLAEQGETAPAQTSTLAPPNSGFAHISRRGGTQFSDWVSVSRNEVGSLGLAEPRFVFKREFTGNGETILIDFIGDPGTITIGGRANRISDALSSGNRNSLRSGRGSANLILLCGASEASGGAAECGRARQRNETHSWRIQLNNVPANASLTVSIEAGFSVNQPDELLAYNRSINEGRDASPIRLKRSSFLSLACNGGTSSDCNLSWSVSERGQRLKRSKYRLLLSDGQELIDDQGRTTNLAFDLGLASVVGFSKSDFGSLSAGLASLNLSEDRDFFVTIDPGIQRLAMDQISNAVSNSAGNNPYAKPRARGAIVILDASNNPATSGNILAMASVPEFKPGFHEWDLVALAEAGGVLNPLAGHSWRQGDVYVTPGSAFKTLTGYAAIEAAESNDELKNLVTGNGRPAELQRLLGGRGGDALVVVPASTPGSNGGLILSGFSKATKNPSQSNCPSTGRQSQMGVCEALIVSSNAWFAGINLYMNGEAVGQPGAGETAELTKAVSYLYPTLTRKDHLAGGCAKCLDLTWGQVEGAVRLRAEPINIAMAVNRSPNIADVAVNSYGQGVGATPLAMASLYASLGAGSVVTPRIMPGSDEAEPPFENTGKDVPTYQDAFSSEAMAALRAGLFGVVNNSSGTARRRISTHSQRIFAKTGSADTPDKRRPNSVSFTGWVEPGENIDRRLSFSCWMSHLPAGNFGGSVCAPVVNTILNGIGAEGAQ